MQTKFVLRTAAGLLALALTGAAQAQATIKDAIEQAFKANPDILIDAARRQASDEALNRANAGYGPRIDFNAGIGREWSNNSSTRAAGNTGSTVLTRREVGLTLSQMLFDGNATKSEVARNQALVDSNAYRLAATADQVALKVVENYLEVLRLADLVALTKENVTSHEKTNDQITLRASSGVGRRADQDQAEARLALARSNLVASEANLRDAEINFKRYVGSLPQNLGKAAEPADTELPTRLDDVVSQSIKNSPQRMQAQADVESAIAQHNAARALASPRIDAELGASRNGNIAGVNGSNDSTYFMLRLRYNIFDNGANKARADETKYQIIQTEEIVRRTEYQLEQNARLAWNAVSSARLRLDSLKQHAESAFATRDAYIKQFSIGQRSLLDVLDTENEYFTAQSDYLNGRYVALFARYRILAETGKLLDVLGIKRPAGSVVASR